MLFSVPLAATIYKLIGINVHRRETEGIGRTAADMVGRIKDEESE